MPTVRCPVCRHKTRVPDDLTGGRITCPECDESLRVPGPKALPEAVEESPEPEPLPLPTVLGMVSLALSVFAVLVLCLPFIGLGSVGLSGAGLLLGLYGVVRCLRQGNPVFGPLARGARGITRFGEGTLDYPVAGVAACLVSLALALLPWLAGWGAP